MESPNTSCETSRYEESIPFAPLRDLSVPQAGSGPRLLGPAEGAILLVFAVELWALSNFTTMPSLVGGISVGCAFSLPPMLVVWSCIESGAWRYWFAAILSLLSSFLLAGGVGIRSPLLFTLPLLSAIPILTVLSILKQEFGCFVPLKLGAGQFFGGLRFSLSHLLVVTTSLAILVPIGKFLWPFFAGAKGLFYVPVFIASIVLLISITTLMFVWALMSETMILRVCIAIPVAVAMLMACNFLGAPDPDYWLWYTITGLPLVSTLLLVMALRSSGWRFLC